MCLWYVITLPAMAWVLPAVLYYAVFASSYAGGDWSGRLALCCRGAAYVPCRHGGYCRAPATSPAPPGERMNG